MPSSSIQSYSAQVRTAPPSTKTFPTGADAGAALKTARLWVEDQARDFLAKSSLPRNPWDAGSIFEGEVTAASATEPLASLAVYTSEDEYVFEWDDED
jgi:hypothetical protein